jgi:hypothetical protein
MSAAQQACVEVGDADAEVRLGDISGGVVLRAWLRDSR